MDRYESYEPPTGETRPTTRDLVGDTQPSARRPKRRGLGCSRVAIWIGVLLLVYFFAPLRTNVLVLGVDRAIEGTAIGRSDTMILLGLQPLSGQVNMLSIPRDLWVSIPGYGENRINAAHSWGEGAQAGSGPRLAAATVEENFGVNVNYYVRVRLEGFVDVIDALGGIDITLEQAAAGYSAGTHHLDGEQALAFVRNREGDDFYRQAHGQLFIVALAKTVINPLNWLRIPGALIEFAQAVDTNIPFWSWPRLIFALVRAILFGGIDAVVLPREAMTPWVTSGGAQVLLPNWEAILPVVRKLFGVF
ncbi:MAG: LCP family protein [Anaerolineales bacterium]